MKNKIKYLILIITLLLICFFLYKKWQKESFGLHNPKLETQISIKSYLDSTNTKVDYVIIPKNYESFTQIKSDFDVTSIYIFNKNKIAIESNITNDNGSCFSDISKNICNDFKNVNPSFHNKKDKILLDLLLRNTIEISNKKIILEKYDYIIVYSWSKFLTASSSKETLSFLNCKKDNTLIISLNLDYVNSWYGKRKLPNFITQ